MKFWALSLNFKFASLEERAAATPKDEKTLQALKKEFENFVLILTCNRLELYGCSKEGEASGEEQLETWQKLCGFSDQVKERFQKLDNLNALVHLFRVTASMESMVLGETQITGQVRRAYADAQSQGRCAAELHRIFQTAFKLAKRIRRETEMGQFSVSIPSVGVKLAERVTGNLNRKTVGVIGLGEIGRVAAEHFGSVLPKKLLLFNRSSEKAKEFASKLTQEGVQAEAVDRLEELLERSQVIINAVSVELLHSAHLEIFSKKSEDLFLLDLAVPPQVRRIEKDHIFQFYVDDLRKIAEENTGLRLQEAEKADSIVLAEASGLWQRFEGLSAAEAFDRLHSKVLEIREKELQNLRPRLNGISSSDWEKIEKMSERLSSQILQDPILELRSRLERAEDQESWLEFFRNMFKI